MAGVYEVRRTVVYREMGVLGRISGNGAIERAAGRWAVGIEKWNEMNISKVSGADRLGVDKQKSRKRKSRNRQERAKGHLIRYNKQQKLKTRVEGVIMSLKCFGGV